jgi:hypothetical protein
MTGAVEDLIRTLVALREITVQLGPAQLIPGFDRGSNSLRLNGAHVTAFAALEDFLRRRVLEVIRWLGESNIKFKDFPQGLKKFLLEETIKGINFSLQRTEDSDRISFLQLEGLLMDTTVNPLVKFEPSEYCFGRSQSNINKGQIQEFITAMGISDGLESLATIGSAAGLLALGQPSQIFGRLAKNRHRAAHGFGLDYRLQDFMEDINTALPLVAFAFDTCISQCAYALKKSVEDGKILESFSAKNIILRRFEFNVTLETWQEYRKDKFIQELAKGGLKKRITKFSKDNLAVGETILIRGRNGGIEDWMQPF